MARCLSQVKVQFGTQYIQVQCEKYNGHSSLFDHRASYVIHIGPRVATRRVWW